jgi:hypothetical protein
MLRKGTRLRQVEGRCTFSTLSSFQVGCKKITGPGDEGIKRSWVSVTRGIQNVKQNKSFHYNRPLTVWGGEKFTAACVALIK